ncbi:Phosphate-binding protein PstS 1 [Apilactobacillus kunkeei]|nr:phosphate ABC transporter substrate-binding protein PstS family protein [Apilactobacillus kunkeei]MCK8633734.1 phosphate ABC transporter substrate-binding protein PstS family protein [Apilactobacillus kunkeei]CAI2621157.1 Phosphate-binding protein PstS 1 [Apilactobacillus kunkeei]CAI2621307.1 Phosphate-binding protein PstS 1 [Apilactobacillus kunkeei]CAI2621437.1 Phosphate-binding protein PstS 1 [Apilactobacillus kunkeei]CAI2622178.1 Phosphate-binding protein PstS 1 [Apilactobacillus kunkee
MIRIKKLAIMTSAVLFAGTVLTACGVSSASNDKITAVGSTALQPLVEEAANDYQKEHKNLSITVQGGGSGTGLSQLQSRAVTIGNSDVFAENQKGIKSKDIVDHQVAVVGITPVVNKGVGVKNISMKNLQKIFEGKITNWKQVGGKNLPIEVINRVKGSGTRNTFEANVMDGHSTVKAQEQDSNGTVRRIIATTPGAISYLSFSFVDKTIQSLSIDNVKPIDKNVETNAWKIWSYEHMYTAKKVSDNTKKFLAYMNSEEVQKGLVKKLGYISISDMKVKKDANNKVIN